MASVLPKTDSPTSSSMPSAVARPGAPPSDLDVLEVVFVFLVLDDFLVVFFLDLDSVDLHCTENNDFS